MKTLYIVATPIGNLQDITLRALEVLRKVDLILCEDTRTSKKLLQAYEINKPVLAYHQHSKLVKLENIIELLNSGKDLALVSDAGTPGISDPGNVLVSKAMEKGINIVPIPGACAAVVAASICGFGTDKFLFLGFLPKKKGRSKILNQIKEAKYTVIFYESVHRIIKTLEELKEIIPYRKIVLCKELTKMFEQTFRGTAAEILEKLQNEKVKGEYVVVIDA